MCQVGRKHSSRGDRESNGQPNRHASGVDRQATSRSRRRNDAAVASASGRGVVGR